MALWQVEFYIVPRTSEKFCIKKGDLFDDEFLWVNSDSALIIFDEFSRVLPKVKSWSDNINLYGKEDGDCIEVLFKEERIRSVSIRIDWRKDYSILLETLIEFNIKYGFILINQELETIENNELSVSMEIERFKRKELYDKITGGGS